MRWRVSNIPVPEAHLAGLGASLLLHLLRPRRLGASPLTRLGGALMMMGGAGLAGWATRAAGSTDLEQPAQLITNGPYALSRNPMYLAWTLAQVGAGPLFGSQWPLRLLPGVLAATHLSVIREERRLEERFGASYRDYAKRVPRYLW
jgi:protein-S-isoprenylcysteine O-methyltransferase Ste14